MRRERYVVAVSPPCPSFDLGSIRLRVVVMDRVASAAATFGRSKHIETLTEG